MAALYTLHRLLSKLSGGRARIVPYAIYAQPLGSASLSSVRDDPETVTTLCLTGDALPDRRLVDERLPEARARHCCPVRSGGRVLCHPGRRPVRGTHLDRPQTLRRGRGALRVRAGRCPAVRMGLRCVRGTRLSPWARPGAHVEGSRRQSADRRRRVVVQPHLALQPWLDQHTREAGRRQDRTRDLRGDRLDPTGLSLGAFLSASPFVHASLGESRRPTILLREPPTNATQGKQQPD